MPILRSPFWESRLWGRHTKIKTRSDKVNESLRILMIALTATVVFHGGLLPFTHGNTYDAFIHMFFADHYHRSWFDPWEARWYTGFATTSYPPGTHMMIGALMYIMPLRAAFVVVQLAGLLLLVVGVYRSAMLWVSPRAAAYAALVLVLASSVSETVHFFGQLPTIFSLALFLNAQPYFYRWIVFGGWEQLFSAVMLSAATTAAHHVTTIFAGVMFVLPLAIHTLRAYSRRDLPASWRGGLFRFWRPLARGGVLAVLMLLAVVITVYPYWYWSITDPITQVPIPHGTRENFLERPDLGIVFFLIPWGVSLIILPYVLYKAFTSSLWPLGFSIAICFLLGTGGTTPLPRMMLGGAFDILTLDRFTFWGTILVLPFWGLLLDSLLHGRARNIMRNTLGVTLQRVVVAFLLLLMAALASYVSILSTLKPIQPRFVDPVPIVRFLEQDEHYNWRYLTLGFGDQFAYLAAQTTAQSVDGNYHSARRLPDLTRFSIERLENAKYLGVPGLGSLEQFIVNTDRYNLKYIFSNDEFYDPLLFFNGWNRINRLGNGIVVWEKPNVKPLSRLQARGHIPLNHAVMWGILPPLALLIAVAILMKELLSRRAAPLPVFVLNSSAEYENPKYVWRILLLGAVLAFVLGAFLAWHLLSPKHTDQKPGQVIESYYTNLNYRDFRAAYDALDPEFRPSFEDMQFRWNWVGGLVNSFGQLEDVQLTLKHQSANLIDYIVKRTYLTGLSRVTQSNEIRLIKRDGLWRIAPIDLQQVQVPYRIQRQQSVNWATAGRRQASPQINMHRNVLDAPHFMLNGARMVQHKGRYYIIGQATNLDYNPASLAIIGSLYAGETTLSTKAIGKWGGHRLLPYESAGFKIEFDGVLSLADAISMDKFDPKAFIPPEFEHPPSHGVLSARSIVSTNNLYRGVSVNGMSFDEKEGALVMSGLAVNTGHKTATIARINVILYDEKGVPLWVDAGFVDTNIYAGQSTAFEFTFPAASRITPLYALDQDGFEINGIYEDANTIGVRLPQAQDGTIPLNGMGGYSAMRVQVSSMTHSPLF